MDDSILQYLITMGDLQPQDQQIARMDARAQALRQAGQPVMPEQGRVASRMPRNAWLPALAGSIGGGMMQRNADQQRQQLIDQRNQAFKQMLAQRQKPGAQYPAVNGAPPANAGAVDPAGYGSEY